MRSITIALAAISLAGVGSAAFAAPKVSIQSIDAETARVTVAPQAGQKFPQVRAAFLRATSEEALRRGYDWFDLRYVADTTRQRDVTPPLFYRSMTGSASSGIYTVTISGDAMLVPPAPTRVFEPGVDALVTFGKGPKPDKATTADARAVLDELH
ncbi:hypothetical protein [Caulobacter segnis]|uniref:hypothetical protein n=1 Tax=Caulobacter segnis TaxID=88688 RepID=UPI00285E4698|nr:hypothetical protein [Caulobacter segnis]MDR6625381.1 hypothetical protein [Caulobacter segnis]